MQRAVTDLAVLDVAPEILVVRETAPGVGFADIRERTGTALTVADDLVLYG